MQVFCPCFYTGKYQLKQTFSGDPLKAPMCCFWPQNGLLVHGSTGWLLYVMTLRLYFAQALTYWGLKGCAWCARTSLVAIMRLNFELSNLWAVWKLFEPFLCQVCCEGRESNQILNRFRWYHSSYLTKGISDWHYWNWPNESWWWYFIRSSLIRGDPHFVKQKNKM